MEDSQKWIGSHRPHNPKRDQNGNNHYLLPFGLDYPDAVRDPKPDLRSGRSQAQPQKSHRHGPGHELQAAESRGGKGWCEVVFCLSSTIQSAFAKIIF